MMRAIRRDVTAIVVWVVMSFGALAGVGALTQTAACNADGQARPLTPDEKVVVNGALSAADIACLLASPFVSEVDLAQDCKLAIDIVRPFVSSKKTGFARHDKAQAAARPLDDAGYP
jgi:hypothetical protein